MVNKLSGFAGIVYIILGIFIIFKKSFVIPIEPLAAYLLGGITIVYGVSRIMRTINKLKNKDEE